MIAMDEVVAVMVQYCWPSGMGRGLDDVWERGPVLDVWAFFWNKGKVVMAGFLGIQAQKSKFNAHKGTQIMGGGIQRPSRQEGQKVSQNDPPIPRS